MRIGGLFIFIYFFFQGIIFAQCPEDSLNMVKLYQYDVPGQATSNGVAYSDVWGYVDTAGLEYAILGSTDSILIFNVSDKDSIYKVGAEPGEVVNTWRDMKTYDQYLYATTEGNEGLLIFDLSHLPDSFPRVNQVTSEFTTAHNIYIETDSARLYVVGSNGGVREGMIIYDLESDPEIPVLLAKLRLDTLPGEISSMNYYIHDIFVRGDTAYCSHGYTGYALWDTSNPDSIYRVSNLLQLPTSDNASYAHSSWNTDDNNYAYVATEIGNTQIYVVDQTDKENIFLETTWREPLLECNGLTNNVPHNPYVIGDLLYISYYQDGVNILDISTPDSPVRVGYYDTDTTNNVYNGTTANWGVYPFLPSGLIIGSDTRNGLFVLEYNPPTVPIIISDFYLKSIQDENAVQVFWEIESAINVNKFEVQRSIDGRIFQTIGMLEYDPYFRVFEYVDRNLDFDKYYYRLKTVDFDGSFSLTNIETIEFKPSISYSLSPTVSDGNFELSLSEFNTWNIEVYSVTGRLIEKSQFTGENKVFNYSNFQGGNYYLKISSVHGVQVMKFQIVN